MTRDCLDPWQYVEFRPTGEVGPCCVRVIGSLVQQNLAQILNGEKVRRLKADLLRGEPDATCRACGLHGEAPIAEFQEKVRKLVESVRPPEAFDEESYLEANPGLRLAGVDAREHFLEHGRFDGRLLYPRS